MPKQPLQTLSGRILQTVLTDLRDRKGFDDWWDNIDTAVQRDAKRELLTRIENVLAADPRIDKEQTRWQRAIFDLCCKLAPVANIDGGGCDSADPLDFSLAEIAQAVNHHANIINDAVQIIKDDCPEGGTPADLAWACEEVAACDKLFRENDDLMQIAEGTDGLVDVINILWNRLQEAEGKGMGAQL